MQYPLVSVIVPNWNGESLLRECLESLGKLKYPNYEIIVVDNGSTDNSIELIKKSFRETKIIVNPTNLGFAGACNVGIKVAKGDIIALFNNDAFPEPNWLSKLVSTLLEEEKIAIAGGPIFYAQPNEILWSAGMRIDGITGTTWRVGHSKRLSQVSGVNDLDYLSGCAIIFKKNVIDEIGVFDETFFLYGEEVDWTFRAIRFGYKFKFNRSASVWHKASFTRRKTPSKGYYYFIRSRFRNYFINYPLRYLITSLFFQIVIYPVAEVLIFKTPSNYILARFEAFAWNLAHLGETMKKRSKANSIGQLNVKNRFKEFMKVLLDDRTSKTYDF